MKDSFIFQLSTLGQNILLSSSIVMAIVLAIISIRKFKGILDQLLIASLLLFLLLFTPIFELWILGAWTAWPEGFVPGPESYSEKVILNHQFYNSVYFILQSLSTIFLIYSIIILINIIQTISERTTSWDKIKLRIPLINIAFVGIELRKLLAPNTFLKFLVAPWMLLAALWVYFKFLANPLVEFGVNSYAYLDRYFFDENFQSRLETTGDKFSKLDISPIGYDYASIFVMNNMVVSLVTFLAGISTLGLAIGIKKFAELPTALSGKNT